jgi:serine/threonine protein kinase/tetratricopeptide (TPR) repeat protein
MRGIDGTEALSGSDAERNPVERLAEEFAEKCRQGSCPSVTQYVAAFPDYAGEIRELFPSIAMIEQLGREQRAERDPLPAGPDTSDAELKRLGDFRILREIGRGGMGVVYEAIQESLGRRVAVKVLSGPTIASPNQLKRFQREAQAAAQLHHTNIVPVFGVGSEGGRHYYVMQFIDGIGLDQITGHRADPVNPHSHAEPGRGPSQEPSSSLLAHITPARLFSDSRSGSGSDARDHWKAVAWIGLQLADAVAYAHRQGVLHRDLKPANLLLDAQGAVWITDFGLAKLPDDEALTQSGDVVGTLRYMAPEQFQGESTASTDIYSLGLTLCELATQRPAFDATDRHDLIRRITQQGPPRPVTVAPAIPRDLDTILAKCTAYRPGDRYASADLLADDLQRFIDGEPIRTRRVSVAERFWRWARRNPAVATLSGLSLLLLILVVSVILMAYFQVDEQRRKAVSLAKDKAETAQLAERAKETAFRQMHRAESEHARAEGNLQLAMTAFDDIIERVSSRGVPTSVEIGLSSDHELAEPRRATAADVELLQGLLKFYVAFAEQNESVQAIQVETAEAYKGIGKIYERLERFEEAIAAYDRALQLYEQFPPDGDSTREFTLAAVEVLNLRGAAHRRAGHAMDAIDDHLEAKDRLLDLAASARETPECQFTLATTYNCLGSLHPAVTRAAGPPVPSGPRWLRGLAGRGGGGQRRGPPWLEDHRRIAIDILLELVAQEPQNVEYLLALARSYRNCLATAWRGEHLGDAEDYLAKAVELLEQLQEQFPGDPRFRYELADVLSVVIPSGGKGETAQAHQRLERAIAIARHLLEASPNQRDYLVLLANALSTQGRLFARQNSQAQAQRCMEEALSLLGQAVEQNGHAPPYTSLYARTTLELGRLLRNMGLAKRSRVVLENGVRVLTAVKGSEHVSEKTPSRFGALRFELAETLKTLGEHDLAEKTLSAETRF